MLALAGLCCLFLLAAAAQAADPWADQVIAIEYGPGSGFGQDWFPQNVLGPPDSSATPSQPSADPAQILSLGSGGVIVLAFLDGGITDGTGPDFTIFENPFLIGGDSTMVFRETGFVAVSQDGVTWQEFPWDAITFSGLAGVTPTNGAASATDPAVSGGDSFDLADLGLPIITFVRITDTDGLVSDDGDSFDLDAVVAVHGEQNVIQNSGDPQVSLFPNPFNSHTRVVFSQQYSGPVRISVFDLLGRRTTLSDAIFPSGENSVDLQLQAPAGIYFIEVQTNGGVTTVKAIHFH